MRIRRVTDQNKVVVIVLPCNGFDTVAIADNPWGRQRLCARVVTWRIGLFVGIDGDHLREHQPKALSRLQQGAFATGGLTAGHAVRSLPLGRVAGPGRMGKVWRADYTDTDRMVAIKLLPGR